MNHNSYKNQIRVNHRIRAPEVRVISDTGGQVGVMPVGAALKIAMEQGMDLVEVAPEARPPVCRIVDFGKFRYEMAKKSKHDVKHTHASKLKELKFHVNIGQHDYDNKMKHAADFLGKGMRVKVSLYFRGREMAHQEYGRQLMERVINDVAAYGHCDAQPRLLGKNLHMILAPGKAKLKTTGTSPAPGAAPDAPSAPRPTAPDASKSFGTTIHIDLKATGA